MRAAVVFMQVTRNLDLNWYDNAHCSECQTAMHFIVIPNTRCVHNAYMYYEGGTLHSFMVY